MENNSLLKNAEYFKLLIGLIIAHFADAVIQIAMIAWIIAFMNVAGKSIAAVFFFFLLPQFLISPFSGVIADKFDRKKIIVFSNIYRFILVVIVALLAKYMPVRENVSLCLVVINTMAFMLGLGYTFFYSAKMPIVTNIVPSSQLKYANALNSGFVNFMNIFGAAVGGILVIKTGLFKVLIFSALLYLWASIMFGFIKIVFEQKYNCLKTKVAQDMKTSCKYLFTHSTAFQIILLSVSISLIVSTFTNALNTLTVDYYNLGITGITWFRVMLGSGILAGMSLTLFLAKTKKISFIFLIGFFILFLTLVTAPLCKSLMLAWYWLIPFGTANVLILVIIDTMLQKTVPDRMRGKVYGLQLTLNTLAFLMGSFIVMNVNIAPLDLFKMLGVLSGIFMVLIGLNQHKMFKSFFKSFTLSRRKNG